MPGAVGRVIDAASELGAAESDLSYGKETTLAYVALIEVDNSREDPDEGKRGLREELAPALSVMPGFQSTLLLTAYDRGRGVAVVVFETKEQADQLRSGLTEGAEIRAGVTVTRTDTLEVSASA